MAFATPCFPWRITPAGGKLGFLEWPSTVAPSLAGALRFESFGLHTLSLGER